VQRPDRPTTNKVRGGDSFKEGRISNLSQDDIEISTVAARQGLLGYVTKSLLISPKDCYFAANENWGGQTTHPKSAGGWRLTEFFHFLANCRRIKIAHAAAVNFRPVRVRTQSHPPSHLLSKSAE
jgi:hypothetical protein